MNNQKNIRQKVWKQLRTVAKPDSRFHYNFAEFIPDFEGSTQCASAIQAMDLYQQAENIFITPDNCLEKLREYCIYDEKPYIMPTYGIRRAFLKLTEERVPPHQEEFSSTLDGAERFGKRVGLQDIKKQVDFMVTGACVVNKNGLRYGKGHGFFDLEWAMFRETGLVDQSTPVIVVCHEFQVVDQSFERKPYDTIADMIVTPKQVIRVETDYEKPEGIYWKQLPKDMISNIPPLQYLQEKLDT